MIEKIKVVAIGASTGLIVARAVAGDLYTGAQLARMLAIVTMAMVLGTTLSPLLGGVIVTHLGWHAGFWVLLGASAALAAFCAASLPETGAHARSAQLSIGYSLLYQEADGIPKLKWILMFKSKPEEMARVTNEVVSYYQQLADTMRKLSKQLPAMRIDVAAMSEIESDERKAIGVDVAKDFAPLVGKTGVQFEREALLLFYNTLNEQRHLTGVMVGVETDPTLKKFLETTKTQLEARYANVGALLNRRYFTQ